MTTPAEQEVVTKSHLAAAANTLANHRAERERAVADIDGQVEKLMRERDARVREAHIYEVKQKAIRAAIRVMEDHGII